MNRSAFISRLPGLFILALGAWIALYAGTFPTLDDGHPGPALFPRLVAAGLVLCGLVLTLRPGDKPSTDAPLPGWMNLVQLLGGVLFVVAFPAIRESLGFIPTAALMALVFSLALGARWLPAAATAGVAAGVIYLLFTRLLGVPL